MTDTFSIPRTRRFPRVGRVTMLVAIALLMAATATVTAQELPTEEFEPTYGLGDQVLSINLGTLFPLFFTGGPEGLEPANLTVGGTGHLTWSSFLNNNLAVGGEFGGMFAFTPNNNTLFMIPVAARITWFPRLYPFEFPLSLAAGINFSRFDEAFKTDPIVIPGAGFYWNFNTEWAFGLDLRYWFVPQIYLGPSPPASDTRFGNFLATTLAVLYRF